MLSAVGGEREPVSHSRPSRSAAPRALGIEVDSHLLYAVACRCRLLGVPNGSDQAEPRMMSSTGMMIRMDRRRSCVAAGAGEGGVVAVA